MRGFTFEIKNNLLEQKHIEAMGIAVWLFMWLDDKITKIDEDGVGWVLGGKPIIFEDVKKELGISHRTYTRWVAQLAKYPYIKAIRTPTGISFRVFKAHKTFGRKVENKLEKAEKQVAKVLKEIVKVKSDSPHVARGVANSGESESPYVANPNKDSITVDNNNDIGAAKASPAIKHKKLQLEGKQWNELIDPFEKVNPMYARFYRNKSQRQALQEVAQTIGYEKTKFLIDHLPGLTHKKFAPKITTPCQLADKLGELQTFWKQEKQVITNKFTAGKVTVPKKPNA